MTLILLNALLPIFVGLLLGYIAGRRGVMDNLNVRNLIVLVMDFAIPCALFYTISRTFWHVLVEQLEPAVMMGVVICGFVCCQLCLGKKKPQNVHFRCLCTCTDCGLSKFCGRSFAVADNGLRSWFNRHSCPLNRSRSYHDLPLNRCVA